MRTLTAPIISALAARPVGIAQLVTMYLTSTVYLNTTAWSLSWNGNTYLGAANVGLIEVIEDAPGEIKGLSFQLTGVGSANLALALAEPVQGKRVVVETVIFNASSVVVDAMVEWEGRLDVMTIQEEGGSATITATAEHIGIDLLRPANSLYSNAEQQRLHASDKFCEYIIDQAEQPLIWPSASFWRK